MSQVTVNEQTFTIQDEPVTLSHAIVNANDLAAFETTIRVGQYDFMDAAHRDVDLFDDFLIARAVASCPPFGMSYDIVAVASDGTNDLIIRVRQDIRGMLNGLDESELEDVATETLQAAVERFKLSGPWGATGVLYERAMQEAGL